jgi:hypothetical protein
MARARKRPVSNHSLADLLRRTGWTMSEAAKRINARAGDYGLRLTYRASSVSHWLTGVQPRPEAIPIIVETFAFALDLPELTADEFGWPTMERKSVGDPWLGDVPTWLATLARSDVLDPYGSAASDVYSAARLSIPPPSSCGSPLTGSGSIGHCSSSSDVRRTHRSAQELLRHFDLFGGCHTWLESSSLLANEVVPLLRSATAPSRPGLLRAVSGFVCVVGMAADDAGAPGRAQKYYILALRLAEEAGDFVTYALLGFLLATQAIQAGLADKATELLDTVSDRADVRDNPSLRVGSACFYALAHARAGNPREALASLAAAERGVQKAESAPELDWLTTDLSYLRGRTLMVLGDLAGAVSYLTDSLATHDPAKHRSRALVGLHLARVQVRMGSIEKAAATVRMVADDVHAVSSAAVQTELAVLQNTWRFADYPLPTAVSRKRMGIHAPWPIGPHIRNVGAELPLAASAGRLKRHHVRAGAVT